MRMAQRMVIARPRWSGKSCMVEACVVGRILCDQLSNLAARYRIAGRSLHLGARQSRESELTFIAIPAYGHSTARRHDIDDETDGMPEILPGKEHAAQLAAPMEYRRQPTSEKRPEQAIHGLVESTHDAARIPVLPYNVMSIPRRPIVVSVIHPKSPR
jgi:hypothetical protein